MAWTLSIFIEMGSQSILIDNYITHIAAIQVMIKTTLIKSIIWSTNIIANNAPKFT